MLVRDTTGRLHIISRKDCKHDLDYYQKLVKIRSGYTQYYKSINNLNYYKGLYNRRNKLNMEYAL